MSVPDDAGRLRFDLTSERAVVGAVLRDCRTIPVLTPDHFTQHTYRRIYSAARNLERSGKFTLPEIRLALRGRDDDASIGAQFLADLMGEAPPSKLLPQFVNQLLELGRVREAVDQADAFTRALLDGERARAAEHLEAVRHALEDSAESGPRVVTTSMSDLLDTPPRPVDWIASGIVARSKSTGLAAKRKGGKSKAVHQLALDVAAEREFALEHEDFRILNPGPVLWLDMEQGRDELASMSHRLIAGGEYDETELHRIRTGFHFKTRERRLDFADEADLIELRKIVETEGIVLTVIDSISAVQASYGSENDNSGRRRMYNNVIAPLLDLGTGVIAFGHTAIAHKDSDSQVELRTRGGGDVLGTFDSSCYIVGTRHEREHGDHGRVIRTIATMGTLESRGADFDKCRIVLEGIAPAPGEIPGPLKVYAEPILRGIGDTDVRDVNRLADAIVAAVADTPRFRSEVAKSLELSSGDHLFREALSLCTFDGRLTERKANAKEKDRFRQTHTGGGKIPSVLEAIE